MDKPKAMSRTKAESKDEKGVPAREAGGLSMPEVGARLRQERQRLNLSLAEAAKLTGLSKAMLSAIERAEKTPTIRVLVDVVEGYGTNISELLFGQAPSTKESLISMVRVADRRRLVEPSTGVIRDLLSTAFLSQGIEVLWIEIPPSAVHGPLPPRHTGVKQHVTVVSGRLALTVDQSTEVLEPGDSAHFPADRMHTFTNAGVGACCVFVVLDTAPKS